MAYGGGTTQYTDNPSWNDPLGPTSIAKGKNGKEIDTYSPTGAVEQRADIFSHLNAAKPSIDASTGKVVSGLETAANDPGWAAAQENARATIRGDYLAGSPQLDAAMASNRRQQLDAAADQNARQGAQYARSGMSFSTGNQQAADSNTAAAAAAAGNTEAQARLSNYLNERQNQIKGADQLQTATGAPLNYLQNVTQAQMNPLASEASLVSGLSTGGPVSTPQSTIVKNAGTGDYLQGALSAY